MKSGRLTLKKFFKLILNKLNNFHMRHLKSYMLNLFYVILNYQKFGNPSQKKSQDNFI